MNEQRLELTETDGAGNVIATYVSSPTGSEQTCRIDIVEPTTKRPWQRLLDVFLPAGYPHSVTDDYLEYQIYDSLQAFASSIAGLLSSRAVLSSVGVGDATASPTAALLLSILQESAGRIATIIFADRFGTALEPECKMYRLLADVLNDFAFVLDCLSPAFPKPIRVVILSFSSVLRALCGVAAGSAKASLSAHFARWGNLGELNAKDSSQETVISLMGMMVGSLVVSWVTSPQATWTTLIFLLAVHLETNRRAVRAVSMRTLNRQRATLVYHHLNRGYVPTPEEVSKQERIFEWDGILRDAADAITGHCLVGTSVAVPSRFVTFARSGKRSMQVNSQWLSENLKTRDQRYLLTIQDRSHRPQTFIILHKEAVTADILTGWWHALAIARECARLNSNKRSAEDDPDDAMLVLLARTAAEPARLMQTYKSELGKAGWDLDTNALETRSSRRISIAAP
ncbi:hypothetical protein LTR91_002052 [Friedmanniomyces endolithicus]|uniref:DUF647 domain-containing protein n=1 Tax=Friedmanniomyces endolithicus TaxID=329885 RepID=A0AAN6KZ92_9PEZI|nr:hypothetical protein LTR57_004080 [Friedmanniomyces endolithicus]KAK0993924.1 hypothetical protein LTS01_007341 [Friedmanniomyces endolithicus]KAK1011581.1 hypothetical protein LTR91_002052 [Friedmanniomyces endolithicus]KAK1054968.1 hypothetical protein LTS16_000614 [Friedmanniomyces endolithicus]